jgi:hypothetical protein
MKKSSLPAQKKNNVFCEYIIWLPYVHRIRIELPYRIVVVIPQNTTDFAGYGFMAFGAGDEGTGPYKSVPRVIMGAMKPHYLYICM